MSRSYGNPSKKTFTKKRAGWIARMTGTGFSSSSPSLIVSKLNGMTYYLDSRKEHPRWTLDKQLARIFPNRETARGHKHLTGCGGSVRSVYNAVQ